MSLLDVTIGPNAPHEVNVIVEIPRFSTNKYELDKDFGVIRLNRVLHSPLFYPWDYGYIPQTHYLDGDPVDALLLVSHPCPPGTIVDAKPIGVLEMRDEGDPDEKILCVASNDPRFGDREDLSKVHQHTLDEIHHFFEVYKTLENKNVDVLGWKGKDEALAIIERFRTDRR